ncbi:MAG: signal peptide peptidase SppA, partial [Bacteroidales bacterium]
QALETGLADELWGQDELISYLSSVYDGIPENRIPKAGLQDYIQYLQLNTKKFPREKIALVYASGDIVSGKGLGQVFAEAYAEQLRKYRNDSTVKGVVVRVESPGGDPLASAIIARELQMTRNVKPVVVSIGDMGASGGYWIASAADGIYVNPSTLTGSIGVYSISFNGEKTLNELLSIRNETVDTHPFSHFDSYYHSKSQRELEIIGEQVEATYNRFLDVVSQNRAMDRQTVEELADGRIWSGTDAIDKGLADQKGGLADAIRNAALRAGVTDYRLVVYPQPFRIMDLINMSGRKVMADPQTIIRNQIRDLLGDQGLQARLPFDEKALSW